MPHPDLRFRFMRWWANHGLSNWSRQSMFRKISRHYDGMIGRSALMDGIRMDYRIGDPVDTSIAVFGCFEPVLSEIIIKVAKEHRAFIDVGCNIGYFTCLFARHRPDAKCLAIDANPSMTVRCLQNVTLNCLIEPSRQMVIVNTGVASSHGQLRLGIGRNRPSQASFRKIVDEHDESIMVEVDTLSHLLSAHGFDYPEVLKVDIEGYEPACFGGLTKEHAASLRHIFFEYAPEHMSRCGFSPDNLWSLPLWNEFGLYVIGDHSTLPIDRKVIQRDKLFSGMLWAIRR